MEPDVKMLIGRAQQAAREGRRDDADAAYCAVLAMDPENPQALNALGNRALASGNAGMACMLLGRATAADPAAPAIWLNLSLARRAANDIDGELAALNSALAADPYFVIALLHKAQWFERQGRVDEAVRTYRGLLDASPAPETLPPALHAPLAHGRALVAAADTEMDAAIRSEIGYGKIESERVEHCLDVLSGRRAVYVQKPVGLHVPYLPAIQFFDRALFPWFERFEAATPKIRGELEQLVHDGFSSAPYVQIATGQPVNQWAALNHSYDWGALFVWKDGRPVEDIVRRCPVTAELIGTLPLLDIPGRGPTAMFSTLAPHAHIPPHHGVTNLRSVVHLPLILPDGCRFRVGSETRSWRSGVAWAFDDTIEHEAWNDSNAVRVILILDVWNPLLNERERAALRTVSEVIQRFKLGAV